MLGFALKVLEVTNTDFALRQFLLPLMRALRARGHEAVGVAPEGPLCDAVRAEGFRVLAVPMARSHSPAAHWRTLPLLRATIRAERPDVVHAHMPISGFLGRVAGRLAGCRGSPTPATDCCSPSRARGRAAPSPTPWNGWVRAWAGHS